MNKVNAIWTIGLIVNVIGIFVMMLCYRSFFEPRIHTVIVWIVVNFVPISVVLAYSHYRNVDVSSKTLVILTSLLVFVCTTSLLSKYFLPEAIPYNRILEYEPFFALLVLQFLIIYKALSLHRDNNEVRKISKIPRAEDMKLENVEQIEMQYVSERIVRLLDIKRDHQEKFDIASDASIKYSLQFRLDELDDIVAALKKRLSDFGG